MLGVVPEPASGRPGGTVRLSLQLFDALQHPTVRQARGLFSADAGAGAGMGTAEPAVPLSIAWLGACHNPPGDAHYGCYPLLRAIAERLPDPIPSSVTNSSPALATAFGLGQSFSLSLPEDILAARQLTPMAAPFGVSFAFFAACRGVLRPAPDAVGVPFRCEGPRGEVVPDGEGFVRGFTRVYTFEGSVNSNPVILASSINGVDISSEQGCDDDTDCALAFSGDLSGLCRSPLVATLSAPSNLPTQRCVPAVQRCTAPPCQRYELLPTLDTAQFESDPSSAAPRAEPPPELVWVKYYALGPIADNEALIQDRTSGFHPDYAASWTPPGITFDPPLPIWAVVQDNRGGVALTRWDFVVTE